jgi:hypothetical protein
MVSVTWIPYEFALSLAKRHLVRTGDVRASNLHSPCHLNHVTPYYFLDLSNEQTAL